MRRFLLARVVSNWLLIYEWQGSAGHGVAQRGLANGNPVIMVDRSIDISIEDEQVDSNHHLRLLRSDQHDLLQRIFSLAMILLCSCCCKNIAT